MLVGSLFHCSKRYSALLLCRRGAWSLAAREHKLWNAAVDYMTASLGSRASHYDVKHSFC